MILERYIVRSLVGPFLLGFGIITFLLTMDMLLDLLDLIIGKGIPVWTVARLFVLALGWIVALSVPCGVLVASLMTYGRMSQDSEIVALRASGVHLGRVLAPALWLAGIVAIALTLFNNYVLPETNYAYASLLQEINRKRPTAEIREGVLIDGFRGYHLFIGRMDDKTGRMSDVLILDGTASPQSPRTILARGGDLRFDPTSGALQLELRDGEVHEADPNSINGDYRWMHFDAQSLRILDAEEVWRQTSERRRGEREMSIATMRAERKKIAKDRAGIETQLGETLVQIGVADVPELNRLDPGGAPQKSNFARAIQKALGRSAPPGRQWSVDERRVIDLARSREREARSLAKRENALAVEIHKKFSIPVACVIFVLVGAPLGMRARRGGLTVGFLSAGFFIFYYLCLIGGEQLADRRLLPPWLAMWLANIVLGLLGVILTLRAMQVGPAAGVKSAARP